jgi:hypothetical protein
MKTVTKKQKVQEYVDKDVTFFITDDGKEFKSKKAAEEHENLIIKFPKLNEYCIDFLESAVDIQEIYEDLCEAIINSNEAIILYDHSGREAANFELVEPHLIAVRAVIKALHRKTVGCNCNRYVCGVIYRGESLCFDDEKKSEWSFYTTGGGARNIKDVLPQS